MTGAAVGSAVAGEEAVFETFELEEVLEDLTGAEVFAGALVDEPAARS